MTLHTIYRDPFSLGSPHIQECAPGLNLAELAHRVPALPRDFARRGQIAVNGEVIPAEWWGAVRPKAHAVVTFHVAVGGGSSNGKQIFALVAAIALTLATGGIASGALAPILGSAFAAGTLGASLLAAGVGLAGSLIISALTSPPTVQQDTGGQGANRRLEAAAVEGNILDPNTPIPRVIGTRRTYPPFACEPLIELVNQDEVVEAIYCLAGPHSLSDFRLGDAGLEVPANDTKDVEIEIREGLPDDLPLSLISRQGRSTEPNVELSVHIVDLENPNTLDDTVDDPLPVYHAVTTRSVPDENWIQFLLAGLVRQDATTDSLRIPIRIRMKRRDSDVWRYLPEIHYRDVTQSTKRLQLKIFWGNPYVGTLITPPASIGFVTAYYKVPAQSVAPLGEIWYCDSYFYDGVGDTYYASGNVATTGLLNIGLYTDKVFIYLDETEWEPGIYDIEIKRGEVFSNVSFTVSTYVYAGNTLDFFGRIDAGTLPVSRGGLLDSLTLVRLCNVWNEYPIDQNGLTLIALQAKNRSVRRLSCLASGYVQDLISGQGPYFGAGSFANAFWSWDTPGAFADGEVLALIRPTTAAGTESADRPESIGIAIRGDASNNGYILHLGSLGTGGTDQLVLAKAVAGVFDQVDSVKFNWEVNKNYFLRLSAIGTTIRAKAWPGSLPEPEDWMISVTDAEVAAAGYGGVYLLENLSEGYVNWFSAGLSSATAPSPPDHTHPLATDFSEQTLDTDLDDTADWTLQFGAANWALITALTQLPYNGQATAWTTLATTSNPAAHFRDVLAGTNNLDPLPSELLDEANLIEWRRRCAEADFTCNMVVEGLEISDLLRVVSSCGYARLYRSELWGVTIDKSRTGDTPVQIFTPRNSSTFSWRKAFARLPAGFRVNYREEDQDYGIDQIQIYREGAEGSGAKLEQVTYDGLIARADIVRRATFDLAQAEKRSTFYTFDTSAEAIVCRRGSLIGVNHDIVTAHYGYARIKDVIIDEGTVTGLVLDSQVEIKYEADVLGTLDILDVTNVLDLGLQSAVAVRKTSGETSVHTLSINTETAYTDEVEFLTPVSVRGIAGSIHDRYNVPEIDVGCLVVVGLAGSEYKRLVVSEIQPSVDLTAKLVCVDEASEIFETVFGATY